MTPHDRGRHREGPRHEERVPDDTGEAKVIRQEAQREMAELQRQAAFVERVTRALVERRKQNHFGEDIEITFRPRRGHA